MIRSEVRLKNESDLFKHAGLVYDEFKKYNNKKILLGASATEFPSDLFSYYDLVQFYINKLPSEIKEIKLACVIAAEYSGIGKFWQTAANNSGFKYRAFTAAQQAEEWIVK